MIKQDEAVKHHLTALATIKMTTLPAQLPDRYRHIGRDTDTIP